MESLAFLLALLLAVSASFYTLFRARRNGTTTLLDWTLLAIAGFYGIGWASVIVSFGTIEGYYWTPWLERTQRIWPLHTILSSMLVIGILFGWQMAAKKHRRPRSIKIRSNGIAWALLFLAVAAQYLYSQAYGGLWSLTQNVTAISIRSGLSEISNPYSFLQPFGLFSAASTMLFIGMFWENKRLGTLFGVLFSAAFSTYVYFTLFGRLDFLVFVLSLVLGRAFFAGTSAVGIISRGALLMPAVVLLAFFLSAYFEVKNQSSISLFFFNEFSFPFASFVSIMNAESIQLYYFRDLFLLPAYLLPSSIYGQYLPAVSAQNTFLVLGTERGLGGATGGIPVDLLSLGYFQLGVVGIPLIGIVWGAGLRKLQHFLDRIEPRGIRSISTAYVSIKVAVFGVLYTQPEHIITRNFSLIAALILVWLISRVKWRGRTK